MTSIQGDQKLSLFIAVSAAFLALSFSACRSLSSDHSTRLPDPLRVEERVVEYLRDGRQHQAEQLLAAQLPYFPNSQRLAFLRATLVRSRFNLNQAILAMGAVVEMDPNTAEGIASRFCLALDGGRFVMRNMKDFERYAEFKNDDPFIRWLFAIQCRQQNWNKTGKRHFAILLKLWDPGPVLIHQTYANILDELGEHHRALEHRETAVEQEPEGWSYQGLGITYTWLGRFEEADEAFIKALNLDNNSRSWQTWAWSEYRRGDFEHAAQLCEKAVYLDRGNWNAWALWADALTELGQLQDAVEKARQSLILRPELPELQRRLRDLEKRLGGNFQI